MIFFPLQVFFKNANHIVDTVKSGYSLKHLQQAYEREHKTSKCHLHNILHVIVNDDAKTFEFFCQCANTTREKTGFKSIDPAAVPPNKAVLVCSL